MIDTHAHLDGLDDPHAAIARARAVGVGRIVAIASGLESTRVTLALAEGEEGVAVAAGVHPHQAADGESIEELAALAAGKVVAIGEIGLDFYRDYAPREAQRRLFADQLRLAGELGTAVIVHSRAADDETATALEDFGGTVVLHCFSSPGLLPVALERGYYVSFAGNVTYPKAAELREAAAKVPPEKVLAETDCPYLAPQPVRGRTNEPAYVVHTIASLAETRDEDPEELGRRIDANAAAAFGLP
ncbi:MAG: TatD family deoxyribonuclease [Actinobacteria bacterium]|nr:MAG: TatD family deoxyribonuclease [Actinomycetota bacterium]